MESKCYFIKKDIGVVFCAECTDEYHSHNKVEHLICYKELKMKNSSKLFILPKWRYNSSIRGEFRSRKRFSTSSQ